jgi:hypothetical protein
MNKLTYMYRLQNGDERKTTSTRAEAITRKAWLHSLRNQGKRHAPTFYGATDFAYDAEIAAIEIALQS